MSEKLTIENPALQHLAQAYWDAKVRMEGRAYDTKAMQSRIAEHEKRDDADRHTQEAIVNVFEQGGHKELLDNFLFEMEAMRNEKDD